jgi:hypothetical protein
MQLAGKKMYVAALVLDTTVFVNDLSTNSPILADLIGMKVPRLISYLVNVTDV